MLENLIDFFTTYGYLSVFGTLLISGFGIPIPEDITLVAGGFISSLDCSIEGSFFSSLQQCHQVHIMFGVGMAGVLIGDSTVFFLGRIFGQKTIKIKYISKIITTERYEWAQQKFEKYGIFFVFAARFMPGLRSLIFIFTGISQKVSYLKFLFIDGLAALISVPVWVYLGFWAERQLTDMHILKHYIKKGQISLIIIALFILIAISFWFIRKKYIQNKLL